jgi:hypothetical protein
MKFIIELEIGSCSSEVCSAKAEDRSQHKNSSAWAVQATVRPCRRRTEIPERNPKQTQESCRFGSVRQARPGARSDDSEHPIVKPLPPEWFIEYGTNAEMRTDSVAGTVYVTPNERFFEITGSGGGTLTGRPVAGRGETAPRAKGSGTG